MLLDDGRLGGPRFSPWRSWLPGIDGAEWEGRDRENPNASSATVMPVTHSGTRSERISVGRPIVHANDAHGPAAA
jgi:hypothetical protein